MEQFRLTFCNICLPETGIAISCVKLTATLYNLVPRVLRLFGQRLVARRDICIRTCIVLLQKSCDSTKFQFPRVSPGDQPLAKEPEDSGYEIELSMVETHRLLHL